MLQKAIRVHRVHKSGWFTEVDWGRWTGTKTPQVRKLNKGALLIGTSIHSAILEQECFEMQYLCAPDVNLRTKDGKQAFAEFENKAVVNNQVVLKKDEFKQVEMMRNSALAYPLVAELLENGEAELSIFYRTENGTLLKIRPDWLGIYSGVPFTHKKLIPGMVTN